MAPLGDAHEGVAVSGLLARRTTDRLRTIARSATTASFVLLGVITVLGLPLWTEAAPLGIVSLQFATSPEAAATMLDSWSAVPRARLLWAHGLDLLLPVAYAVAIVAASTRLAASSADARRWATIASASAVVAAIADQLENVALGVTILLAPSWTAVLVTLVGATVKTALLVVALGALIVAGVRRGGAR
jgi:hypothetical protein